MKKNHFITNKFMSKRAQYFFKSTDWPLAIYRFVIYLGYMEFRNDHSLITY